MTKLTIITISLFLLSLVGNVIFLDKQRGLKSKSDKTVLMMDSLLSVKLLADKELDKIKIEIDSYKGRNSELYKTLADLNSKLNASEIQVEKLAKDNAGVNTLRGKLKEFQKLGSESEKIMNSYRKDNEKLQAQNNTLNQSINKLSQELADLKEKLEFAKNLKANDIVIINYRNSGKNNIPTIKAKKVNRISATFNLAENPVAEPGYKEIYMVVYGTKGNVIGAQNKKFTNKSSKQEQPYSASKPLEYKNEEVKTTVNFDTEEKLVKGKYRIDIYIDGDYGGKKEFILK